MIYSVPPVAGNVYNTWEVAAAPNTFRVLIDPTDFNGDDMTSWLQSINIGDILYIREFENVSNFAYYRIASLATNQGGILYYFDVIHIESNNIGNTTAWNTKRFNIGYAPRGPTGPGGPGGGDGADGMTGLAGNSSLWKYVHSNANVTPNPQPGEFSWFAGGTNPGVNPWGTSALVFNPVDSIDPNGQNMRDWLLSMKHGDIIYIRRFEFLPEFCYHTVTLLQLKITLLLDLSQLM